MMGRRLIALMAGVLWVSCASMEAEAFVRTQTCSNSGGSFACEAGESPKDIFWPSSCVNYHINLDFGGLGEDETVAALEESFEAWNAVECSGLEMVFAGTTDEDRVGFLNSAGLSGNANVLLVRSDRWDHMRGVLALTSVTFSPSDGKIVDADIEINSVDFTLTTGDQRVRIDIANTMTHEAGHFLGLDHTTIDDATMFPTAPLGETSKRSLDQDDIDGVCDAYPVGGQASSACLGAPAGVYDRNEAGDCGERFFSECDDAFIPQDPTTTCACEVGGAGTGTPWGLWWVLGGLLAWGLRRAQVRGGVWLGLGAAACLLAVPQSAEAFVRTQTCSNSGSFACEAGENPKDIFWPARCVVYHLNEVGTDDTDNDRSNSAIVASFEAWNAPACSGIEFIFGGFTDEDRIGYNPFTGPGLNGNVIVFRNSDWIHESGVLALTSVTFRPSSGAILDADIELNGRDFNFTTTNDPLRTIVDVANTVTHEAGHFLGLDHTSQEDATMFATAPIQELAKRTLSQDDIDGVCASYPVEFTPTSPACAGATVGFFPRPRSGPDDGPPPLEAATCGCDSLSGRRAGAGWPMVVLAGAALLAARRWVS